MQILFVVLIVFTLAALPFAWLAMLAAGNFGFAEFGLIDCYPLGVLLAALANNSKVV